MLFTSTFINSSANLIVYKLVFGFSKDNRIKPFLSEGFNVGEKRGSLKFRQNSAFRAQEKFCAHDDNTAWGRVWANRWLKYIPFHSQYKGFLSTSEPRHCIVFKDQGLKVKQLARQKLHGSGHSAHLGWNSNWQESVEHVVTGGDNEPLNLVSLHVLPADLDVGLEVIAIAVGQNFEECV